MCAKVAGDVSDAQPPARGSGAADVRLNLGRERRRVLAVELDLLGENRRRVELGQVVKGQQQVVPGGDVIRIDVQGTSERRARPRDVAASHQGHAKIAVRFDVVRIELDGAVGEANRPLPCGPAGRGVRRGATGERPSPAAVA